MTDLDGLWALWRESSTRPHPLGSEELHALVRARAAEAKRRTAARVRAESSTYLVLIALPVAMLVMSHGLSLRALRASLGVVSAVGPIVAVLAYKEYRLGTVPLGGELRQSLSALVAAIDSASRAYLAAYLLCVTAGVALAEAQLARRYGPSLATGGALVLGVLFMAWAYASGRAYAERIFRSERRALVECLEEIEGG